MTVSTNASRLRRVSRAFLWMSIRSVLGNWIARHNQLLWFRSNGQRLERSQVPQVRVRSLDANLGILPLLGALPCFFVLAFSSPTRADTLMPNSVVSSVRRYLGLLVACGSRGSKGGARISILGRLLRGGKVPHVYLV